MARVNDTIVALATNLSTQAIALIRISGDQAFKIINKVVKKPVPYKKGIFLRQLFNGGKMLDEVVINAYTTPSSFTGEDVIEIACHGGILNTNQILKLVLNQGARMALKGEFSQRAFINGKIDLIQAEGINDLIHATNDLALKIGADNLSGKHNQAIVKLKADLLDIISRIQTSIDYPDYDDVEGSTPPELLTFLKTIKVEIDSLLRRSKMANKSITGISTVIVGKTNVGKSSLLNRLLSEEKAIVTEIPGTTRDVVEGQISLGGVNLNLIDTAGIRQTSDLVEALGIEKARTYLQKAELVLFVVNGDQIADLENQELFNLVANKTFILIVNKSDQLSSHQTQSLRQKYPDLVFTSALNDDVDQLINKIQTKYQSEDLLGSDALILINTNQISLLEQLQNKIETGLTNLQAGYPIDIINVDLYAAWDLLNELIGEQYDEEIIDNIFRKYCLGK